MSTTTTSPTGPTGPTANPPGPRVRLQTWVNVVLVLILLASCGESRLTADDVASRVANKVGSVDSIESVDPVEVQDLCRLLGAVAARQKVPLDTVLPTDTTSSCHQVAQEAATAVTAP